MSKFVDNVNKYLSQMEIKQSFISLKTGIEVNELSSILKGSQEITSVNMDPKLFFTQGSREVSSRNSPCS